MISRLLLEDVDRRDARGDDRRRMRGREQERPRAVIQELDQRPAARDVAAERADRLRQRPDLDVDAPVHAEVVDRAAPVLAEHAARMGIVDHHDAAEFLGQRAQLRQRAEVAVHAEHAVGDEQLALAGRQLRQDLARGVDVLVREHLDRGAAQAGAVDDAGVIQLVGNHDVVLGQDGGDGAGVRGEAALEHDDGFGLLERGQPAFELHVDVHGAGDRAHRAGPDAEPPDRVEGPFAQPRVRRQPEVVVRGEIDDLTMIERRLVALLAFEDTELAVQALLLERVELAPEIVQRIAARHSRQSPVSNKQSSVRQSAAVAVWARLQPAPGLARVQYMTGDRVWGLATCGWRLVALRQQKQSRPGQDGDREVDRREEGHHVVDATEM